MRRWFDMLACIALSLAAASCTAYNLENEYAAQDESIGAYVESLVLKDSTLRVEYMSGVAKVVVEDGFGDYLSSSSEAGIWYCGYNFSAFSIGKGNLFATNLRSVAESSGWNLSDEGTFELARIDLSDRDLLEGLRLGLDGARIGEHCLLFFSGRYGFRKKTGTIDAGVPLAFEIWVEE